MSSEPDCCPKAHGQLKERAEGLGYRRIVTQQAQLTHLCGTALEIKLDCFF